MDGMPPGLRGYMAAAQAGQQQDTADMSKLSTLMQLKQASDAQARDAQIRGIMSNTQDPQEAIKALSQQGPEGLRAATSLVALHEAQNKNRVSDANAKMTEDMAPMLANGGGQLTADQLDTIGAKYSLAGHPGAAAIMKLADTRRTQAENKQAIGNMQSRPGVTPVTAVDDSGLPMPSIPAQAGVMDALLNSKYVGPQAKNLQSMIDRGAGMTPQQIQAHADRLTALHVAGQRSDEIQAQLNSRQDKANNVRITLHNTPAGGAGYGEIVNKDNSNLHGDEFLKTLNPRDASTVKALAEGRILSSELSMKGGHREAMLAAANQYMPGFDSPTAKGNAASYNALVKQYDAVTSFEKNAVRNGEVLMKLADKVDATGLPVIEKWIRLGRQATGNPDVAEFNAQMQIYRTEAARILTNPNLSGQLTDAARKEVEHFLGGNASADQIRRVVTRLKSDFEMRRTTLEQQMQDNRDRGRVSRGVPSNPEQVPGAGGLTSRPSGRPKVYNPDTRSLD